MNIQENKALRFALGLFVLIMGVLFISSLVYKKEDLRNSTPLREFTFNLCEKYPSQADFFLKNKTKIYTNPQETGITGYIESCAGWLAVVYREEVYNGDVWLLMTIADTQGWQKQEIME